MSLSPAQRKLVLARPAGWIATGFGSGLAPIAPGTAGSLAVLLPYLLLHRYLSIWGLLLVLVPMFIAGVRSADWVIRELKLEDPGAVVIDEWFGQCLTLVLMELTLRHLVELARTPSFALVVGVGFLAFRICDIAKPWPANWADRELHGGIGTMLDDSFAALWAAPLGVVALMLL